MQYTEKQETKKELKPKQESKSKPEPKPEPKPEAKPTPKPAPATRTVEQETARAKAILEGRTPPPAEDLRRLHRRRRILGNDACAQSQ